MSSRGYPDQITTLDAVRNYDPHAGGAQLASREAVPGKAMTGLGSRNVSATTEDLWRYYDTLGEVHYPYSLGGNMASRVELNLYKRDGAGKWVAISPTENGKTLGHARNALYDMQPCASTLFRRGWMTIGMPGYGYLVRERDEAQHYSCQFLSGDELVGGSGGGWRRKASTFQDEEAIKGDVFEVWRPHPKLWGDPDGALASVATECRELEALKLSMLARVSSRLASMGILFLPSSLQVPTATGMLTGHEAGMVFRDLFSANIDRARNTAAAAAAPVVFMGNKDDGEKIRHILLDTSFTDVEESYRKDLRAIIAQGIELPVEKQAAGEGGSVNHWGAWSIDESALVDHVLPTCRLLAWELTQRVLWPWLRTKGVPDDEVRTYCFGADATEAALAAVRVDAARQLHQLGLLKDEAVRRVHGFSEEDAPSTDEVMRFLGVKLNIPMLAAAGVKGIDEGLLDPAILGGASQPGEGGYDMDEGAVTPENRPTPERGLDQS
jgi:hypothetical protein